MLNQSSQENSLNLKLFRELKLHKDYQQFTEEELTAGNIVRLSGNTWSTLDSGFNSQVKCIYIDSLDNVFAGGQFSSSASHEGRGETRHWWARQIIVDYLHQLVLN